MIGLLKTCKLIIQVPYDIITATLYIMMNSLNSQLTLKPYLMIFNSKFDLRKDAKLVGI